jgi:uncharacterized membrane protein YhaH (DUF805 family)
LTQSIIGILITIGIYAIVIYSTDSGRCTRYEYIVKTLVIIGLCLVSGAGMVINFTIFRFSTFFVLVFIAIVFVSAFSHLKFTIQRFYDLDLSGCFILLTLIPIFNIVVTLYLFFKKGNDKTNQYDKAIDYKKLFKDKHFIDLYKDKIIVNIEEYPMEKYRGKFTIKISGYKTKNFFTEYLQNNFPVTQKDMYKIVEITKDEFEVIIADFNLLTIYESYYLVVKNFQIMIRKRDFYYSIVLDKENNEISKELFETFDFPGAYVEDEQYVYYNRIGKEDLLKWMKNTVA